jgi:hypothetical protein
MYTAKVFGLMLWAGLVILIGELIDTMRGSYDRTRTTRANVGRTW